MHRISDLPVFDAADYLETPRDCAEFLIDLIRDGSEDDVRRGLAAVARATRRPMDDLPREILDALLGSEAAHLPAARDMIERLGIRTAGSPTPPS